MNLLWQTQATILSKNAQTSLLSRILRQNVLPCLLLFFSFLPSPLDTFFLYLKCSGSQKGLLWGDLPGPYLCCLWASLFCQDLLCYLIPHAPHKATFDALKCGAQKNQPNPRVSTAMETPRDDPAEPRSLNPGVTRRSVGRNREGHLWTSHLPDTVTKTSGGPSRGLCGGRANNVNIIMSQGKKQQPSTQNPRAYIHGIHFLSNWASWHLMQAPDLSRVPFPQWNRGKVITIMRGPWKDGLKDLKWEEGAACQIPILFCLLRRDLGMVIPSPTLGWMNASTELNTLIHSLWKSKHTFHTPGRFVVVGRSRKKKIGKGEKEEVNRSLRWDC